MLPDGTAVKKVWKEIFKYSKNKQYLIDCSTIDVKTSLETQKEAKEKNLLTLDAPVSGGVIGADNGTLTFMVGGDINVYNDQYADLIRFSFGLFWINVFILKWWISYLNIIVYGYQWVYQ